MRYLPGSAMMALREACISFVWWTPARDASGGWTKTVLS
jgi:hypothetical protein